MRSIVACVLLSLALAAGCSNADDRTVAGATELGCDNGAIHPLAVGHLLNNMWNRQLAGSAPYRQCLLSRVRDGRTEFGWQWQWPGRDGIYAYPELLIGRSPWTDTPNNDPRFPRRVDDTRSLVIDYDVESSHAGKRNLAMEMWLTRSRPAGTAADARDISTELMVWTDASSGMFSKTDKPEAVVDIDGMTWTLHVDRGWGDVSGQSAHRWTFIRYVATRSTLVVRYDARRILQDAIDRGLVDPTHYIADVELGNEIVSGTGSTWIRRFDIRIE